MRQVTVISGVQRRRHWSDEQKHALVAAISAPGANVARVARLADIRPRQIYRWRRQLERAGHGFAQVQVQPDPAPVAVAGTAIIVEFERAIVRIPAGVSPGLAAAVLRSVKP
ncbi:MULTISPECIES: transposase [unclassified Blastomonas]|jgi:transposase|uniref:transposase n=1 Tax=unclassified Blastomonas TaxID=2626550 RepID=UPI0009EB54A7|nr:MULTISPECIES: transposase [unclassified Blastomonas]